MSIRNFGPGDRVEFDGPPCAQGKPLVLTGTMPGFDLSGHAMVEVEDGNDVRVDAAALRPASS